MTWLICCWFCSCVLIINDFFFDKWYFGCCILLSQIGTSLYFRKFPFSFSCICLIIFWDSHFTRIVGSCAKCIGMPLPLSLVLSLNSSPGMRNLIYLCTFFISFFFSIRSFFCLDLFCIGMYIVFIYHPFELHLCV